MERLMGERIVLNTGASMPLVGMGTSKRSSDSSATHQDKKEAILTAIKVGYRHFDCAPIYESEEFVGEAVQEAICSGLVEREELFITTKLHFTDSWPEGVLPAIHTSLRKLQVDYVDLYLIHFPARLKKGDAYLLKAEEVLPLDLPGTWAALESCVEQGLTKAIGVCNFSSKKIADLLSIAKIPPAVNQVEMHTKWQQKRLREVCKKANVQIIAFSSLGSPLRRNGSILVLEDPIITDIATKYGKTPAQIVLRWALDKGVCVIPKSYNEKRMIENMQVFGWSLTGQDHERIEQIEQKKYMSASFFCSPNGPFKTVEEFWDGEI